MRFIKVGGKKTVTMIQKSANMNAYMYGNSEKKGHKRKGKR